MPPTDRAHPGDLRVLIIEPAGLLGGSERALIDLLSHLPPDRATVTVAIPTGKPLSTVLAANGVATIEGPIGMLHRKGKVARVAALAWLAATMLRIRPDVVHVNQAGITRIVAMAARLTGSPVVAHVRMQEDAVMLRENRIRAGKPDACIAISKAVLEELNGTTRTHRPAFISELIYDPFDSDNFSRGVPEGANTSVREELGFPDDAQIVIHIGRICAQKGQDLLVEAAANLSRADVRYVMVGSDATGAAESAYRDALESRVRELGLGDTVRFLGERSDISRLIRGSDLLVASSRNESFGRVLLEALSLGCPIVGPDSAGPAEVIGSDERGLRFVAGDPASLSAVIASALDNPEAARERTRAGATWVSETCSPSVHAERVVSFWNRTAGHSRASRT